MRLRPTRRGRRGSALTLVLVISLVLGFIAFATASIALQGRKTEGSVRQDGDLAYRCQSAAELLRLEVVRHWRAAGSPPAGIWLASVRPVGAPGAPLPGQDFPGTPGYLGGGHYPRAYPAFPGVTAWIDRMGPGGQNWLEIVAATDATVGAAKQDTRRAQSVRVRLQWGNNPIFDLALLTVTTNCMFCHLKVKGDVGSIGFFRPGWGTEDASGHGSGGHGNPGSSIDGDVYVARADASSPYAAQRNISDDTGDPLVTSTINGTTLAAGKTINLDYAGPKLPQDVYPVGAPDGIPDFPTVDTSVARAQAHGSVWAGPSTTTGDPSPTNPGAWVIPLNGTFADRQPQTKTGAAANHGLGDGNQPVVEGNLILVGTDANPIEINGDLFVSGDVVIRGPVKGKGAIYAGRNLYVAGDVYYPTGFRPAQWPLQDDAAAQDSLANEPNAAELRLTARENVVIGDYTYRKSDGTVSKVRDRQGEEFIFSQFNFWSDRYYEADASGAVVSNELKKVGSRYYNDLGEEVPASRVAAVAGGSWGDPVTDTIAWIPQTRYDSAMAPGNVKRDASGNAQFTPWLRDHEFRGILGTASYDNLSWRSPTLDSDAKRLEQLGPAWDTSSEFPNWDEGWYKASENRYVRNSGSTSVLDTGSHVWTQQVKRVDAFLYANKRVAGTSPALTVNGGIAATEVGILAPGYQEEWWMGDWYNRVNLPASVHTYRQNPPPSAFGDSQKTQNLNYDYRLRNGGYGFNLIEGEQGNVMFFLREGRAVAP